MITLRLADTAPATLAEVVDRLMLEAHDRDAEAAAILATARTDLRLLARARTHEGATCARRRPGRARRPGAWKLAGSVLTYGEGV